MVNKLMPALLGCFLLFSAGRLGAQSPAEKEIRSVLQRQSAHWNQGLIDSFMHGYWESDSLLFVGKSGITRGYAATLARYKKAYPDAATMGRLTFSEISVRFLSEHCALVLGHWSLQRAADAPGGYFSLVFELKNGRWVIVTDHTS